MNDGSICCLELHQFEFHFEFNNIMFCLCSTEEMKSYRGRERVNYERILTSDVSNGELER